MAGMTKGSMSKLCCEATSYETGSWLEAVLALLGGFRAFRFGVKGYAPLYSRKRLILLKIQAFLYFYRDSSLSVFEFKTLQNSVPSFCNVAPYRH
jgi:hypothetical protein